MTSIHEEGEGSARSERDGLANRLEQLENVLAVAGLGYCRIDPETRSLQASAQFKAEFGFAPDALIDWAALLQRIAIGQRDTLADMLRSAPSHAGDLQLLVQSVWPDGSSQWIALRGRCIHALGAPATVILTSQNVTAEQKSAADQASERSAVIDRERRLRVGAEAANRGKDQFLSVFSHELRSPLNAILGWNRILALKRAGDSEVTSITARIEHSARAQLKMVNDLLDLGRIETGKLRIEARPMQLAKVAAAAVDLARPTAAAKGITITADFAPGAGQLRGDPDRLQQVVANLLSNAVKFTSSGGEIRVTLRNHQGFSELAVQDSGQGIAPELLPHVFDRFRQGDTSSTRSTGGLGLGLALVREIVHLHGGTVSASSPGRGLGASFVARFPNRQPWKSDAAPAESQPSA
ncbi:MAG: HAMP domain-containing histidine kinase, partial [Sinobacteraceae bacterium]|nr:HAMP domain-containing histidine kinase [Nevskiaceae bacterium]